MPVRRRRRRQQTMRCHVRPVRGARWVPGSGVRRITAIRRPYIVNDQGQFEMVPSFDVTITHTVQFTTTTPVVTSAQASIHRV